MDLREIIETCRRKRGASIDPMFRYRTPRFGRLPDRAISPERGSQIAYSKQATRNKARPHIWGNLKGRAALARRPNVR
jgi:hypothetical protein